MQRYPLPPSTAGAARHLFRTVVAPFPLVCFTLALATDVTYWLTSHLLWQEFSAWLLLVGLAVAVVVAAVKVAGFLLSPERRDEGPPWPQVVGGGAVLALAFLNNLVHARDGWTAVVPQGLILSALTVIVLLAVSWLGAPRGLRADLGARRYV